MNNNVRSFKVVLLGESAVGKSSVVLRFCKQAFLDYQESTIGASFMTQTISLDNRSIRLELWDTAGQERYHALAPMYYRGASVAVVVYDITAKATFERAKLWVDELHRQAGANIIIMLVGNKTDMENHREVDTTTAENYANENGIGFMETSAKTAHNINEVFVNIARRVIKLPEPAQAKDRIAVLEANHYHKRKKTCCK